MNTFKKQFSKAVIDRTTRATVSIWVPDGSGLGWAISPHMIVTNRHVIETTNKKTGKKTPCKEVLIRGHGSVDLLVEAQQIFRSPVNDVALLIFPKPHGFPTLEMCHGSEFPPGTALALVRPPLAARPRRDRGRVPFKAGPVNLLESFPEFSYEQDGWGHVAYTQLRGLRGDSGSPVILPDGRVAGMFTAVCIHKSCFFCDPPEDEIDEDTMAPGGCWGDSVLTIRSIATFVRPFLKREKKSGFPLPKH